MAAAGERCKRVPAVLRPVSNDCLEIRRDPAKGRGVFARTPIPPGTLIDSAPVVLAAHSERARLDQTIVHDYYFVWDDDGTAAIALGLVSLCNHSRRPNARVRPNRVHHTLDLLTLAAVAAGEEITIDYNCPLWFAPRE